ncbi:MAG: hypothetical protein L0Y57_11660 [Beijerinckiaceae bacterium]|nr:hypothetical protein [Beijerinckiaceae bacterium]
MKFLRTAALSTAIAFCGALGGTGGAIAAGPGPGAAGVLTLAAPVPEALVEKARYYRRHYWRHRRYWRPYRRYWHRPYYWRPYRRYYSGYYWRPYRHYYYRPRYWRPYRPYYYRRFW